MKLAAKIFFLSLLCVFIAAAQSPTSVDNITANSATLKWTVASGERYDVELPPETRISGQNGTNDSFINATGLTSGTSYTWQVRKAKKGNTPEGPWVAGLAFKTLAASQPPASPLNLRATTTTSSATLSWGPVAGAVKYKYQVYDDQYVNRIEEGEVSTPSVTVNKLSAAKTYAWGVCAVNAAGQEGNWSRSTFTTPVEPPKAPSHLEATSPTSSGVSLSWREGSGATSYDVQILESPLYNVVQSFNVTSTSAVITGLKSSTKYYAKVCSRNTGGISDSWIQAEFTTLSPPKPASPSVGYSTTSSSVTFTFTSVAGATSYDVKLYDKQNNGTLVGSGSTTDASKPVTISNLKSKTKYYYEATVTVGGQTSDPTKDSFETDTGPVAPNAPSVRVTPAATSASFIFTAVTGASSYDVKVHDKRNNGTLVGSGSTSDATKPVTIESLKSKTTYYYDATVTLNGLTSIPTSDSFETLEGSAGPKPPEVNVTATSNSANFTFTAVTGATSYDVRVLEKHGNSNNELGKGSTTDPTKPVVITGLSSRTKYDYEATMTVSGQTSQAATGSFTTLDASTLPPAPTVTFKETANSVTFTFTAVANATSYDVRVLEKHGNSNNELGKGSTTDPTKPVVITGLSSKTKYDYEATVTVLGQTSQAATGSFTTLDASTLPSAPTVAVKEAATSVTFTFTAYPNATSYAVRVLDKHGNSSTELGSGSTTDPTKPVVIGNLQPKSNYDYEATVTLVGGQTSQAATGSFKTLDATTLPQAPTVAVKEAATSVTFTFTAYPNATSYAVRVLDKHGNSSTELGSGSTTDPTKPVVITGLSSKTKYDYEATVTVSGQTSQAATGSFTTLDASTLPSAPTVRFQETASSVSFTFDPITGATLYEVRVLDKQNNGTVVGSGSTANAANSVVVSKLEPKTKYYYEATVTLSGQTSQAATGSFTTLDASTLPSAPSVTFRETASSVTFTFAAVSGASLYEVKVLDKQNNGSVVGSGSTASASNSVVISGLQPKTKYYYEATATVSGQVSQTATGSFTTLDESTQPPAPSVTFRETTNSVAFTFAAVAGATLYEVRVLDKQNNGSLVGSGSTTDPTRPVVISNLQPKTKYYYEATATVSGQITQTAAGSFTTSDATSAVEKIEGEVPLQILLSQNYPNPFNPSTSIEFSLPASSYVRLAIFNALGNKIQSLVDGFYYSGRYLVTWDASAFPSGVYFYRLQTQKSVETKRLMLVK